MHPKIQRAMRACRADGGQVSVPDDGMDESDRYTRFGKPIAAAVDFLRDVVKSPFDLASDARNAGGYSNLDVERVGREGLMQGLGLLGGTTLFTKPKGALSAGAAREGAYAPGGGPAVVRERRIFDTSPEALDRVPEVTQVDYVEPAYIRGLPEHVKKQRLDGKRNMDRLRGYVEAGDELGGRGWYNTDQLREAFVAELGAERGLAEYQKLMDLTSATSAQSKVGENIRNASYRYVDAAQGGGKPAVDFKPPSPYGHYAQQLHNRQVATVLDGALDPIQNPKVFRFGQNLRGNQVPVTIDSHATRAIGLRNKSGDFVDLPDLAYEHLGNIVRRLAKERDMTPAQAQASMWIGAGDETGLRSPRDPFLKVFEDRVRYTADKRGLDPEIVLRRVIRGEEPLLSRTNPVPLSAYDAERDASDGMRTY